MNVFDRSFKANQSFTNILLLLSQFLMNQNSKDFLKYMLNCRDPSYIPLLFVKNESFSLPKM